MQRSIRPAHEPIHAHLIIPGSKSITHRALLLAALADGVSELTGLELGTGTLTLIKALHQLGIVAQLDPQSHSCIIAGGNGKFPKKQATIWCGNAKSITPFLIAACAPTPGVYYFDGSASVRSLALVSLLHILCRQGAQIIPGETRHLPFTLIGSDTLEGGEVMLDESTSSQLISTLLMIAPHARSSLNFTHIGLMNQQSIDMTCDMMAEFGVLVHRVHQGQFIVPVPQRYQAHDYVVEPNLSIAAYFFAAAAITQGEVTIQPIKRFSFKQADISFLSALEKMGCQVLETHKGLTVKGPAKLKSLDFNIQHYPDSFLALAAMAPFADSPIQISGLNKASRKSLERLHIFKNELMKMNISIEAGEDWIKIFPGKPKGCLIKTGHNAHVAMAFSVMGLKVKGIALDDAKCVEKIYPDFFSQWDRMTRLADIKV